MGPAPSELHHNISVSIYLFITAYGNVCLDRDMSRKFKSQNSFPFHAIWVKFVSDFEIWILILNSSVRQVRVLEFQFRTCISEQFGSSPDCVPRLVTWSESSGRVKNSVSANRSDPSFKIYWSLRELRVLSKSNFEGRLFGRLPFNPPDFNSRPFNPQDINPAF